MNVIAIQSSGNQTSLCAIIKDDVVQYSLKHERKERPNWSEMLSNIGLDSFFTLEEIDIFAYANNSLNFQSQPRKTHESNKDSCSIEVSSPKITWVAS